MFQSARIRLTLWYLLIIAFISFSFSGIVYRDVIRELENGFTTAEYRVRGLPIPLNRQAVRLLLQDEFDHARHIVLVRLFVFNGLVLAVAGLGGYFLAGKTLEPIEDMVEEQKRFIADASHELRTPLTSIMTETEVTLRERKLNAKDLKNILSSNLEEIYKLKRFTDYLLSLSRYESKGIKTAFEKLDLKKVVEEAIHRNSGLMTEKNIKTIVKLDDAKVKGNINDLIELTSILINNAIKYSPKGSSIDIILENKNKLATVLIKDKGVGINQSDLPHIFDRFYRADNSRSKLKADGFGLGLSIAKSIAKSHNTEIKVESKIGKGSIFRFTLYSLSS